jgi:hypothetical protein
MGHGAFSVESGSDFTVVKDRTSQGACGVVLLGHSLIIPNPTVAFLVIFLLDFSSNGNRSPTAASAQRAASSP